MQSDEYRLLHEFRYQLRRFLHFSEEAARSAGIEPQQHQLLLTVKAAGEAEGLPIREVAERLQLRHNSAVELVDRAEGRGLVSRVPASADRRQVLVRLTGDAEALLERLSTTHLAELREAAPALVRVLTRLTEATAAARGGER